MSNDRQEGLVRQIGRAPGRSPSRATRRESWRAAFGRLLLVLVVTLLVAPVIPAAARPPGEDVEIVVLSNRADLISGGDALVEVKLPDTVDPAAVRVELNGDDITEMFAVRPNGRYMGLVTGLREGDNELVARASRASGAKITITNHPIGGPVFSGPQVQPWICSTEEAGLGPPQDEQCNAPAKVEYFYKSTNPVLAEAGLQPYDPTNPPSDVATTTTDQGQEVPFIVRVETGTMNRGMYQFAMLSDPERPLVPWNANPEWNRKVYYDFLGGGSPNYIQGRPRGWYVGSAFVAIRPPMFALSRGWALATSSLNRLEQNTNFATSAESVMMLKEHIAESAGEIRYTISGGCSGGSTQQMTIADGYPGILDAINPCGSVADLVQAANDYTDCALLTRYFNETSPHLWPVAAQQSAVEGFVSKGFCAFFEVVEEDNVLRGPTYGCTLRQRASTPVGDEPAWTYDPVRNPSGARCTMQDHMTSIFGARPADSWDEVEQSLGRGFANREFDNTGVQFGLNALESGLILPEQFVDLNEKIGGFDIDRNWQEQRSAADRYALDVSYRTGWGVHGNGLAAVPIINMTSYHGDLEAHPAYRSYSIRERLIQANGHYENQVIWENSPVSPMRREAFLLTDRWLAAIEADTSDDPLEVKVRKNRPAQAADACWIGGEKVTDQGVCRAAFPYRGNPRIAAGEPLINNFLKCQTRPLDRGDYGVTFTEDQWERLQAAFPTGVCDYTKPPVSQQPTISWLSFADGPGGEPLGARPDSAPMKGQRRGGPSDADAGAMSAGGTGGTGGSLASTALPATGWDLHSWGLGLVLLGLVAMGRRPRVAKK